MKKFYLLTKTLLVAALLMVGASSAWATAVPYTVGTPGSGDAWESRKYSDAYEIAPGEIYHFTFTNTSYGSDNWNNWYLDCKATDDTSVDDWYFTMRSDNYGWGTSYNATMRYADFVWADFQTVMNGATVDMYVDYNSTDKIIRTYATITKSETTWHYNFASKAIDAESVFLFLSEELANLYITTAEKVANIPTETYGIYKRSITDGYGYTWDTNTSNPDYTGWTNTGGTKTLDLTDGLKLNIGNNGYAMSTSVFPTVGDIINIDATFFLKGGTGGNNDYSNYAYFRFGNIYITNYGQQCYSRYLLNGAPISGGAGTTFHSTSAGSSSIYRTTGINYRLQLEINTKTNKVVTMKVYVNGAAEPSLNISDVALSSYDYSTIELGYNKARTTNGDNFVQLKDISITETPQEISVVDYTVKFQDALGNTLKADVIHDNGVVGEVYQATAEDLETFYNNADKSLATKKYVYSSGQNTSVEASSTAAENVITLVFTVYDKTAYTVNAQAGGSDIKTGIATGSAYLDGSTTAYWSKYLKVDDQWYVTDETTYGAAITNATTNVAYTATDAIDYFYEFEDMSDNGSVLGALSGNAISGGASQRFNTYGKKWTTALAGGTYTVNLYCNGNNGKSATLPMYYSDPDGSNPVYIGEATACQASTWALKTTTNVVIPEGKALCFYNNVNYTHNYIVDYVTLTRTGDATTTVNLNANGYATYSTCYDVEVSGADAYTAELDFAKETITCTKIASNKVPAGNGVLLYGEPNAEVTLTVVADAAALGTNNLKATTNANGTLVTKGSNNYYSLSGDTFKQFTGAAFVHNKAYFEVTAGGEVQARSMRITFGGITGVENVEAAPVATAKKNGAYLENGRIAIYKNGMKFNAAGQLVK